MWKTPVTRVLKFHIVRVSHRKVNQLGLFSFGENLEEPLVTLRYVSMYFSVVVNR